MSILIHNHVLNAILPQDIFSSAVFDHASLTKDNAVFCVLHSLQPMSNSDHRPPLHFCMQDVLDSLRSFCVNGSGCLIKSVSQSQKNINTTTDCDVYLIENNNRTSPQECSRKSNKLPLTLA